VGDCPQTGRNISTQPDVDHLWPSAFNIIRTARGLHSAALAMPAYDYR
jgi:hypothetical protein